MSVRIRRAAPPDAAAITAMIHDLASFEHAADQCSVVETQISTALFGDNPTLRAHVAEVDGEGYLSVVGRKSDLIIRGGKNISAREVEDEVAAHPRVALAAAVPVPDPVFGERVCVYVELRDDGPLTLEELTEFLLARGVSTEILPERLIVLAELPRSSGDKVAKAELRRAAAKLAPAAS